MSPRLLLLVVAAALALSACGRKADPVWPFDDQPPQQEQSAS